MDRPLDTFPDSHCGQLSSVLIRIQSIRIGENPMRDFDVVVAGGGLAGLCAASFASRAGARVALYESSPDLGGRARTHVKEGYYFNYGPHALYRGGALDSALRDQGLFPRGKVPNLAAG